MKYYIIGIKAIQQISGNNSKLNFDPLYKRFHNTYIQFLNCTSFEYNSYISKLKLQDIKIDLTGEVINFYKTNVINFTLDPLNFDQVEKYNVIKYLDKNGKKKLIGLCNKQYTNNPNDIIYSINNRYIYNTLNSSKISYEFFFKNEVYQSIILSKKLPYNDAFTYFDKEESSQLTDEFYKMFIKNLKKDMLNYKKNLNNIIDNILKLKETR